MEFCKESSYKPKSTPLGALSVGKAGTPVVSAMGLAYSPKPILRRIANASKNSK